MYPHVAKVRPGYRELFSPRARPPVPWRRRVPGPRNWPKTSPVSGSGGRPDGRQGIGEVLHPPSRVGRQGAGGLQPACQAKGSPVILPTGGIGIVPSNHGGGWVEAEEARHDGHDHKASNGVHQHLGVANPRKGCDGREWAQVKRCCQPTTFYHGRAPHHCSRGMSHRSRRTWPSSRVCRITSLRRTPP